MADVRCAILISLLAVVFLTTGCQKEDSRPDGMPELHRVSVTILQNGEPLANASIRLIPKEGTSPWSSGGSTDERGVAVLRTHGKFEGVPAGSYKMTVTKIEMPEPQSTEVSPLDTPNADESSFDLVAPEYTYPNQTPLELEVTPGVNEYEPFDLGPAVRIERQAPPSS